jgi:hypothetical protein
MTILRLRDGCFPHQKSASLGGERAREAPKLIEWRRVDAPPADFYTDICIHEAPAGGEAVAWLLEPPCLLEKARHYAAVEANRTAFRAALTYRADLLADPLYRFAPFGGAWVKPSNFPKTKLISLIASDKRLYAGHRLRHEAAQRFGMRLDLLGWAFDPLPFKALGLEPYAFSVVIENCKGDYFFTEKLIDAFLSRTVPIYWGCPEIGRFFDEHGIIAWNTLDELDWILRKITFGSYAFMAPYIEENANRALKYVCAEDWIAAEYPDLLTGGNP